MDPGILAQQVFNGLMLGVIYAMVAVGFSLFFGVLDIVNFSHGDVVTVGAFSALGAAGIALGLSVPPIIALLFGLLAAAIAGSLVGVLIAKVLVLRLRNAPSVNVLLGTLMAGTVLHEAVRLYVPNGGNPKPFPALLPSTTINVGSFTLGVDSLIILIVGILVIVATHLVITKSSLGLAIRAVAQDSEVARLSGIDFRRTVLGTFALGSFLAAVAGCMLGLYYREINFNMGVILGVIEFRLSRRRRTWESSRAHHRRFLVRGNSDARRCDPTFLKRIQGCRPLCVDHCLNRDIPDGTDR